jgi:hypothetical protein
VVVGFGAGAGVVVVGAGGAAVVVGFGAGGAVVAVGAGCAKEVLARRHKATSEVSAGARAWGRRARATIARRAIKSAIETICAVLRGP